MGSCQREKSNVELKPGANSHSQMCSCFCMGQSAGRDTRMAIMSPWYDACMVHVTATGVGAHPFSNFVHSGSSRLLPLPVNTPSTHALPTTVCIPRHTGAYSNSNSRRRRRNRHLHQALVVVVCGDCEHLLSMCLAHHKLIQRCDLRGETANKGAAEAACARAWSGWDGAC